MIKPEPKAMALEESWVALNTLKTDEENAKEKG